MRTTLDLPDDVLATARTLAAERQISLGNAVAELVRRGQAARSLRSGGPLPTFDVPADAEPITPEMVAAANEDA